MHEALAAVVVVFRPDRDQVGRLIRRLLADFSVVFVMDNGGGREALTELSLLGEHSLRLVDMHGNQGIGAALNCAFDLAHCAEVEYVMTFDQDSEPPPGLAVELLTALQRLTRQGRRVAAVGPRIVDMRPEVAAEHGFMQRQRGWPRSVVCTESSQVVETDFLITSGSLVAMTAYSEVGPFDVNLFVDFVDTEWCLRARAAGFRCFGVCSAIMPHELGVAGRGSFLGMTVLGHSPVRRYFFARNTLRLLRLPYVSAGWKARLLLSLAGRLIMFPLAVGFAGGWTKHWLMLGKGVLHGIAHVGGPYVERGRGGR